MLDLAIIIGHRRGSQGASGNSLTEYGFHAEFAPMLAEACQDAGLSVAVVERRDDSHGYRDLPATVNALKPRFAISMHLNAHDSAASGSEALYWHTSKGDMNGDGVPDRSCALASMLQEAQCDALGLKDRGLKPIEKGHRGWYLLAKTAMTCALIEPCFVSNAYDVTTLLEHRRELASALATAAAEYSRILGGQE